MCSPDTYDVIKKAGGRQSARVDWDTSTAFTESDMDLKVLADQFPYTMSRPGVINEKTIDEIITNAILTVVYGQSTPEQALADLAQELRDNITSNYGDI